MPKEYNNLRNKNAITLVALIVTVVILLVLAGVSVGMIFSENGIAIHAVSSKQKTERSYIIEMGQVDITKEQSNNKSKKITKNQLINVLDQYFKNVDDIKDSEDILSEQLISKSEYGTYEIKVSEIYNGEFLEENVKSKFNPDAIETEEKSIFNYIVDGDKVEIIGFNFFNLEYETVDNVEIYNNIEVGIRVLNHEYLEIPTQIEGKTVTKVSFGSSIGDLNNVLYYKVILGIKKIKYPETCEVLGKQGASFAEVKTLVLSEGLKELQDETFYNWVELENVTIPTTVEVITGQPFLNDLGLIGKVVKILGKEKLDDFIRIEKGWEYISYVKNITDFNDFWELRFCTPFKYEFEK